MTENDQMYSIYKHNASLDVNLFFCFDCRARPELLEPELLEQEVGLLGPDLQIGKVRTDADGRPYLLVKMVWSGNGPELQQEQPGAACIGSQQVSMFNEMSKGQ